jgi:hypothetical protein
MYGDALAQSLVVEVKLLQRRKESVTLICERLQEIANVAVREGLKQWAKDRTVEVCNSLLDTFITHFDIDI